MHAGKRLRTVINAEIGPLFFEADKRLKSSRSYIHNRLFRDIVGVTMPRVDLPWIPDRGWRGLFGVTGWGDRRPFCVCDGKGVTANEIV
jgi:hypothetical protein